MSADLVYSPKNLDELRTALARLPADSHIVAGCTDFLARRGGKYWHADALLSVADVAEMKEITLLPDALRVGASCLHAQTAAHPQARRLFPALADACGGVGSPQIRNRGTVGGNLANASPAGDMLPALLVLEARAVLFDKEGRKRTMPLDDFVRPDGKTVLAPGEVLMAVEIPLPEAGRLSAFRKLGERAYVTIAKLNTAVSLTLEEGLIRRPLVSLGAVARRAFLSQAGAAALEGKPLSAETFDALGGVLSREVERAIPTRPTMPYKRAAIRGVADDLRLLLEERAKEGERAG